MAVKHNIIIDQGANFNIEFDITNDDDELIDFTNQTITAQVRKHFESTNNVAFTCLGLDGKIIMSMDADLTATLTPGRYMYDVIADDAGTVSRIVEGIATVTPRITK